MKIALVLIFFLIFIAFHDFLTFKALNSAFAGCLSRCLWAKSLYWTTAILPLFTLIWALIMASTSKESYYIPNYFYIAFGVLTLFYFPKTFISIFYTFDYLWNLILFKTHLINIIGLGISILVFLWTLHGLTLNRSHFQVRTQEISNSKIPQGFDGFKIIQISDMHIGSFHKHPEDIERLVAEINHEKPDLILFTGDMVSNYANELEEFTHILSQLEAPFGKYAILGNHDYGEYVKWAKPSDSEKNLELLEQLHQKSGFTLLKNTHVNIVIGSDSFQLAGVENWGLPPFPQHGDLATALKHTNPDLFTILLSHDPSHWRAQVLNYSSVDLTLSGHTHAMQLGLEIGNWQWSPASFKYPEWGGLYTEKKQMLYVNRGAGYIGLPGRIGIRPEISQLVLSTIKEPGKNYEL